ncbi:NAD(P)-dependent alcohol dehydrogenase [Pseudoruegeria sp. SHC-113]|uniref:NAD(P)-dependent alcohol dehydrogenase n=1 Tax=Pseudoruegeria sp. SHC-113 TaxID=2855439 RepID=UPI0021BB0540|nr:NAD(P)-dependent alcohol dehydrogenase [Pseudoruegeria sp. SHC-113]MCT8158820.1 NAD(P)-dependent alcohol dehydrogenase [Pseudoruegeria sp. SHC-113]
MKAIVQHRYGGPEVLALKEVRLPEIGEDEILVKVHASSATTADWRIRASAFPKALWLPGRLMMGLVRPRNPIPGGEFAGRVVEVGAKVTRFQPGEAVFGFSGHGANAEYLAMSESACVAPCPPSLSFTEAAALPFGGLAALVFLRDVAALKPGQRVLVVGATGGVGSYAVQIAKALGADVTAICSADNAWLARDLGAEQVLDYRTENPAQLGQRFDLVFDTVGAMDMAAARAVLKRDGLFLPLNFSLREMLQAFRARLFGGPRLQLAVNPDRAEDLEALSELVWEGRLRPVIDRMYPLSEVAEAHAYVEGRHRKGAVILTVAGPDAKSSPPPRGFPLFAA